MNELTHYITMTETTFQKDVVESRVPVLVEFGADWCGGCHILIPVLQDLIKRFANHLKIVHIDYEANPAVSQKYNIHKIPTLMLFKEGTVVEQITGAVPKNVLIDKLQPFLSLNEVEV